MTTQSVGRIVSLECHQPLPEPTCARCAELEAGIREYLAGYVSRRIEQEGRAQVKLAKLIDR